jgi:hypothetical protein
MAMPLERDAGTTGWYINFIQYKVSFVTGRLEHVTAPILDNLCSAL